MHTHTHTLPPYDNAHVSAQNTPTVWPGHDIVHLLDEALVESNARMVNPFRERQFWSPAARAGAATLAQLPRLFARLTDHCISRYGAAGPPEGDVSIMAQLLRVRDAGGAALPRDVVVSQVGIAFVAGHDTTGHTIAFCLYVAVRWYASHAVSCLWPRVLLSWGVVSALHARVSRVLCVQATYHLIPSPHPPHRMLLCQHPQHAATVLAELEAHGLVASPTNPSPRAVEYDDLAQLPFLQVGCVCGPCLNTQLRAACVDRPPLPNHRRQYTISVALYHNHPHLLQPSRQLLRSRFVCFR